ncbi:cache domain-containing protein [Ancylomarina sp. DW003]|nr:cache domain-containing protein [Ancylomarina sp. DW003]MDE5423311.1 cache domain-containing protein [Ancylomarina sp. DW003]
MKSRLINIPRLFRNYNILILLIMGVGFGSLVIIVDYQAYKKDVVKSRAVIENEKKQFLKHSVDNAISYINYNNSKVEERLDEELSLEILNAWKIASGIHSRFKSTRSEQEIKTLIIETLRPLRYFNGRGYLYIIDMDGFNQLHPITPEKEGKIITNIKDITGKYVIQEEINLMRKKKEGFIDYLWTKPNSSDSVSHSKRAFLKRFEPYDWFFGLGEYQDDFKEDLKQETLKWFRQSYDPTKWHLFINDYDGQALIINSDKYQDGVNIKDISDSKGIQIFEEELKIAKNTEGDFLRYSWLNKNTGKYTPQVTYVKGYNQWKWMIGASSSTTTIDKAIAQKENELLINSLRKVTYLLLAMLGASALLFMISQHINKRIRNNFNNFISEFDTAISKQQMLKEDKFNLNELRRLSNSINQLLKNHLKNLDALKLSEKKFRIVVENAPVFICGFTPDGLVKLWNKQCEEHFNYSTENILNNPFPLEELYHSESIKIIDEFRNSPSEAYRLAHVKLKNGQESYKYWASFELSKDLRIWVGHDVTELKLTEQKMRALNATKDKFFSIIAHDLRNPFNALITLSSYLIEAIESSNKTEAIELAKIIETSSEQGFELLVNLLEWSRTQTGAIQYKPELINLQKELKNPIQIIEGIAESKDIKIKHHIDEFTTVFADPNMIRTIVRNLLSNAVKFTPRKGQISFEAFNNDDEVLIKICDNGVGMSQDIIDKLFKIEISTSSTGTEGEMGTGLGLILCSEFVKKHKGKLWVNSKIGEGSCFSFSLPKQPIHT